MHARHNFTKIIFAFLFAFSILIGSPDFASSEETHRFKMMWPTLPQPWYFNEPRDIAIDSSGYVYVADQDPLMKLDPNGNVVTKIGITANGICIDKDDSIYITTGSSGHRIKKYSSNLQLENEWGEVGSSDGQLQNAIGIAADF
jgi:sugar lactone lactonase YvrE